MAADHEFVTIDGPEVVITYDWQVSASIPLLGKLTWLLHPIFAANHRWAMVCGEQSLRLQPWRRRTTSDHERRVVLAPPPTTFGRLVRGGRG